MITKEENAQIVRANLIKSSEKIETLRALFPQENLLTEIQKAVDGLIHRFNSYGTSDGCQDLCPDMDEVIVKWSQMRRDLQGKTYGIHVRGLGVEKHLNTALFRMEQLPWVMFP